MLNYSPTELYFYFRFGCTTPLELIFLSDTFQFVIYTILSYPFAWVISRQKNEEKRNYWIFLLQPIRACRNFSKISMDLKCRGSVQKERTREMKITYIATAASLWSLLIRFSYSIITRERSRRCRRRSPCTSSPATGIRIILIQRNTRSSVSVWPGTGRIAFSCCPMISGGAACRRSCVKGPCT